MSKTVKCNRYNTILYIVMLILYYTVWTTIRAVLIKTNMS